MTNDEAQILINDKWCRKAMCEIGHEASSPKTRILGKTHASPVKTGSKWRKHTN